MVDLCKLPMKGLVWKTCCQEILLIVPNKNVTIFTLVKKRAKYNKLFERVFLSDFVRYERGLHIVFADSQIIKSPYTWLLYATGT